MLLSISFYARSFKEAQSLMGPLNMVIIVPLFLSLGPGMEMDHATALMPLINVGLLTKEILAGSVELIYFIETLFFYCFVLLLGFGFLFSGLKREYHLQSIVLLHTKFFHISIFGGNQK